jgi:hypothetical protein
MLQLMREPPPSVAEMLRGADEDFKVLLSEIAAFFERKPYEVVTEHNADFTKHTQHLKFKEPVPSRRWGRKFYLGVQQLRSALDHLIYAIAIHESGQDPPPDAEKLAFPVMTNPPDIPMWKVASLSGPVKAAILGLQPDPKNVEDSTLWQLEKFNAADKHRVLRMTLSHTVFGSGWVSDHGGGNLTLTWHRVALESEAPFREVTTEHPAPNVKMGAMLVPEVSVERVGGHGQPEDFLPVKPVIRKLGSATLYMIDTVLDAAGL